MFSSVFPSGETKICFLISIYLLDFHGVVYCSCNEGPQKFINDDFDKLDLYGMVILDKKKYGTVIRY